jgi:hypothetical protein
MTSRTEARRGLRSSPRAQVTVVDQAARIVYDSGQRPIGLDATIVPGVAEALRRDAEVDRDAGNGMTLDDLAVVAKRRDEPVIPHEQFVAELKREGVLQEPNHAYERR